MCFQSLILDMAGNVGTQSLAVTIRVLMDESLTGKQKLELVWKEMRIGFSNGLILGVLSFTAHRSLHCTRLKENHLVFAYAVSACIGAVPGSGDGDFRCSGNLYPAFFQKDPCGSGSGFRSSDHHDQRPGGSYFLLWSVLASCSSVSCIWPGSFYIRKQTGCSSSERSVPETAAFFDVPPLFLTICRFFPEKALDKCEMR